MHSAKFELSDEDMCAAFDDIEKFLQLLSNKCDHKYAKDAKEALEIVAQVNCLFCIILFCCNLVPGTSC